MEIWDTSSASEFHFAPVMSYQNEGDKGLNNMTLSEMKSKGNFYYLSFPPITYLAPYYSFKLVGCSPSALALQWFNMMLGVISVFLFYFLMKGVLKARTDEVWQRAGAVSGSLFFLFAPTPLWFFGNGYTHHVLAIPFVLLTLLAYVNIRNAERSSKRQYFLLFLGIFLVVSTVWYGIILAALISFLGVYQWFKSKKCLPFIWIPPLAIMLGLTLFFIHYSSIVGQDVFLSYLGNRFFVRSGMETDSATFIDLILGTGKWYVVGFSLWIMLPLVIWWRSRKEFTFNKLEKNILFIATGTAFLHHFLLREFTVAHNYSVLIDAIYLGILISILFSAKGEKSNENFKLISLFLVLVVGIFQYYFINRPGEISQNGDRYDSFKLIGERIKETAQPDEVVYLVNFHENPAPQLMYYSKRNFLYAKDENHANAQIAERQDKKARIYFIENNKIDRIKIVR